MKKTILILILIITNLCLAANEIHYFDTSGQTNLYVRITRPSDFYIWDTGTSDFNDDPAWASTDIALTEGDPNFNSGLYYCSMPISTAGKYYFEVYSGSSPVKTDVRLTVWEDFWSGTEFINSIDDFDVHTWYVAKDGNDSAGGHTRSSALLTIGQAVTNASSGDMIVIWPGTYTENIDLVTATKSLHLKGFDRGTCIITRSTAGDVINLYNNCGLENLTITTDVIGTCQAVQIDSVYGCRIANCDISSTATTGSVDGLYITDSSYVTVKDCNIFSSWDALYVRSSWGVRIDNCVIISNGESASGTSKALYGAPKTGTIKDQVILTNCTLIADITASNANDAHAAQCGRGFILNNCSLFARTSGSATGNTYGVYSEKYLTVYGSPIINNCNIYSYSESGTEYSLCANTNCIILVANSQYDKSITYGTIVQNDSGWADAANTEMDTALADYDPPTNAEIEARTLPSASYFDPTADPVANVTTVTTLTGHTPQTGDSYSIVTNGTYGNSALKTEMADMNSVLVSAIADVNVTAAGKTGYFLDANGLDFISTTEPSGAPSNFREWLLWLVRAQSNKTELIVEPNNTGVFKIYKTDGTVWTTQDVNECSGIMRRKAINE